MLFFFHIDYRYLHTNREQILKIVIAKFTLRKILDKHSNWSMLLQTIANKTANIRNSLFKNDI